MSTPVRAVICDFGGVLTTPLIQAFSAYQDHSGISPEQLGTAMANGAAELEGANPLYELECGRITEGRFLDILRIHLEPLLGHRPELHRFSELYFEALDPNLPMIELMAAARDRGHRMAMLTNNVREWEPLWRAFLPVDEIFETVVDSGFVGMRKPEPEIYRLTVDRLDGIEAGECLFIDDMEVNCEAARAEGLQAVQFHDNERTIPEIESALQMRGSDRQ
ncbi:MAG TPA: HAD family phosphatase [Solirubrobacterales bacterium]|nr:HAD family phosphatase [Solirubrobacterales bacterium]